MNSCGNTHVLKKHLGSLPILLGNALDACGGRTDGPVPVRIMRRAHLVDQPIVPFTSNSPLPASGLCLLVAWTFPVQRFLVYANVSPFPSSFPVTSITGTPTC